MFSESKATAIQTTPASLLEIKRPKYHHVNLKTIRMTEMIEWYGKVIGARKQFQNEVMGFVTNDETPGRIALLSSPNLTDDPDRERHTGMHHSAWEYDSPDDLFQTWERLHAEGIEPHMALDHGFRAFLLLRGPRRQQRGVAGGLEQ